MIEGALKKQKAKVQHFYNCDVKTDTRTET